MTTSSTNTKSPNRNMRRPSLKCQQLQSWEPGSPQSTSALWASQAFHHQKNSWSKFKFNHQASQMPILTNWFWIIYNNSCLKAKTTCRWPPRCSKPRSTSSCRLRSNSFKTSCKEAFHPTSAKWNVIPTQTNHPSITACAIDSQLTNNASIISKPPLICPSPKKRSGSSSLTQLWATCSKEKYDELKGF